MRPILLSLSLLAASSAFADPPSPEEMAKLQHDMDKATSAVDKKYEGRTLTREEQKQQMAERAAAENGVLEKAGVSRKDYARGSATMSKDERAAFSNQRDQLDKKDKAATAKGAAGTGEVVVEKGNGKTDQEEAAEMDKAMGLGKSKGGSGKKRR